MSAAVAASLPSPLQHFYVVKPVSMTLMLGLFTMALFLVSGSEATDLAAEVQTPPAMDTFSSYEDMQRYFDYRNQRSLRQIENPSKDSYLEAFNYHNEQESHRIKRSALKQKELPQKPTLIKFEMADAVEPSEDVKELIRQYKSRELQKNDKYLETLPPSNTKQQESFAKPIVKRAPAQNLKTFKTDNHFPNLKPLTQAKYLARPKRSAGYNKQPANFKVQYIPFDVSDAREPDEQTKVLIKRMRALEIEKISADLPNPTSSPTNTTKTPPTKRSKYMKQRKPKRSKRSAPEMIKFELSDAKDPDSSLKTFMKTKQTREVKDLKIDKKPVADQDSSDSNGNDQSAQATKRYFVYKDAPAKVKKSVSALPHDVQNIITHLIKGNNGGKAYVKYIPAKQMDYNNLKLAYQAPKQGQVIYGHGGGGGGYAKYAPAQGKGEQVQVEKVKYVYHPVLVGGGGGGGHAGGYDAGGEGGHEAGYAAGGGGSHEAGGAEVKYVAVGGAEGGYGGGYAAGGGHEAGGYEVKYAGAAGGEGGYGVKYATAAGAEGGYGLKYAAAEGGDVGHGGGYAAGGASHEAGGGGGAGHVIKYVAVGGAGGSHGDGYASGKADGESHGGGYAAAGSHGGGYALVHGAGLGAHASYGGYAGHAGGHAGGGYAAHGQAAAAIGHPIVVADAGAGQQKQAAYGAGYGESENAKNNGNEAIKDIAAPQFKAANPDLYETKYSVVPTVEQYAKTPTQDFQLKLYSPESLIAKAQLEAQDKAKAIEEQAKKAEAAAYGHASGGGGEGYGGGHGGGHVGGYVGGQGGGHGGGQGGGQGGGHGGGVGGGYGGGHGGGLGGGHGGGLGGGHGGGHGGGYGGGHGGGQGGGHGGGQGGGHGGGGGGHGGGGAGEGAGPVIKIEYHAPADSFKENYKNMPEFKQLSSLVGKSPEDQIHGLTYLLAKEMQNRLHFQRQHNYGGAEYGAKAGDGGGGGEGEAEGRPQDNKAPVLFHPDGGAGADGHGGEGEQGGAGHYQAIAPGKFIGMAKSKQYIPVIEQGPAEEQKGGGFGGGGKGAAEAGGKLAAPHSYMAYGLSPNYKGISVLKSGAPAAHQSGYSQYGAGITNHNAVHEAGYEAASAKLQSYASKYAFGYRIRDFNTGNDFGHKQNRDLNGVTRGQYHILLPDGRIQNVIYHADDTGFHADVSFETGH